MTADDVRDWLEVMRARGIARTDADCARLLEVTPNVVVRMKRRGADGRTALACGALAQWVPQWRKGKR